MGVKTAEELITEGVRLAGREYDSTDTRPLSDLINWLSSVALGWPWPECSSSITLTLLAGARTALLGGTAPTYAIGKRITRIEFPLEIMHGPDILPDKIYQEAYSASYDVFDVPVGNPNKASYLRSLKITDKTTLVFNKKPKTDIRIHVPYQFDPSVGLLVGSIPWYPNDLTLKQAVAYYTAKHHDGVAAEKTLKLEDDLSIMIRNDKLKFGVIDSFVMKMNRNPRDR